MAKSRLVLMLFFIISILTIGANKILSQNLEYFEQNHFSIAEIKFKGLDDSNDKQKDERWWLFVKEAQPIFQFLAQHKVKIKIGNPVESEKIEISREVFENWLDTKGFQKGKVSVHGEKISDKKIRLIYSFERGEKVIVDSITFVGNKKFSNTELLQVLKDAMPNSWQFWNEGKFDYYTQMNIRKYLQSKGYVRAKLELTSQRKNDSVNVIINVNEGIRYRLGEVEINGLTVISREQFLEMLGIKTGDIANSKLLQDFLYEKLKDVYGNIGYVNYDAEFDPELINPKSEGDDGVLNLKITIDEGKQYKVSKITIISAEYAKDRLKKLLSITEGEIFNRSKFESGIKRINETKDFAFVDKDKDVEFLVTEEIGEIHLIVKVKSKWLAKYI